MPWEQLGAILSQGREDADAEDREPPVACPIDGDILDVKPDETRSCPLGNYRWP